ncbi:major histocompatibility complex class I-related gene protein-like [Anabas testudineus]|uniref:major histocompatibility complex class I-related gene protein-like n=1 Tax=Anabas testudineus TaxID=64144 RepID=UPI00143D9167|nr:major histocompatibility complex class I-related gene protein-like [Anabas testudineus]
MKETMKFIFLLFYLPFTYSVKHSLVIFLTTSSGLQTFPEFVAVAVVDGVQVDYYDSNIRSLEPRQEWVKELNEDDPQNLVSATQYYVCRYQCSKEDIDSIMQHFNQSVGVHILQRLTGCEWDDKTTINGYMDFAYEGEDFISLDLKNLTLLYSQHAATYKDKWDPSNIRVKITYNFLVSLCPDWLKKYLKYGESYLQRKVRPSVSLLQKTPSSPVSCHATGFYPDRASMFWRKDGEEIHEDVDHGEILPNHDGTFQMSVDLKISSVKPEDWSRYDCVFQFSDVKKDVITKLDKAEIRTNWGSTGIRNNEVPPSEFPVVAVIGVVVGLLLLLVCITGLFIWRKKNNGFRPAKTSDPSDRNPAPDHWE